MMMGARTVQPCSHVSHASLLGLTQWAFSSSSFSHAIPSVVDWIRCCVSGAWEKSWVFPKVLEIIVKSKEQRAKSHYKNVSLKSCHCYLFCSLHWIDRKYSEMWAFYSFSLCLIDGFAVRPKAQLFQIKLVFLPRPPFYSSLVSLHGLNAQCV
jgi:hypothetical protein